MFVLINRTNTPASTEMSVPSTRLADHLTSTANESAYGIPSISTVIITMHRSFPSRRRY